MNGFSWTHWPWRFKWPSDTNCGNQPSEGKALYSLIKKNGCCHLLPNCEMTCARCWCFSSWVRFVHRPNRKYYRHGHLSDLLNILSSRLLGVCERLCETHYTKKTPNVLWQSLESPGGSHKSQTYSSVWVQKSWLKPWVSSLLGRFIRSFYWDHSPDWLKKNTHKI